MCARLPTVEAGAPAPQASAPAPEAWIVGLNWLAEAGAPAPQACTAAPEACVPASELTDRRGMRASTRSMRRVSESTARRGMRRAAQLIVPDATLLACPPNGLPISRRKRTKKLSK